MKISLRYLLIPLLLSLSCSLIPSITRVSGSGNVITVQPDFDGFDRLEISHAFSAEITQGRQYEIEIRLDDNLEDELEVRLSGSTLKISLQSNRTYNFNDVTLEVTITMPDLRGIQLSGASHADLAGFSSIESLSLEASGASTILGKIDSGNLSIDVSGASLVNLSGEGDDLNADASGASTIDLEDFLVHDVDAQVSGASKLTVKMDGTLDADLSGASNLVYYGDVQLGNIDTSGASSIDGR
jgi:hypothetical protein